MWIDKNMCERKAYPHKVYPDRNRIRLRVNGAKGCMTMLPLVKYHALEILKVHIKVQQK